MYAKTVLIFDEVTGDVVQRCPGPLPDGACPRVAVGHIVPCAGHAVVPELAPNGAQPYAVPRDDTFCPVTRAAAVAVAFNASLPLDD